MELPTADPREHQRGEGGPDDLHLDYVAIIVLAVILVAAVFIIGGDTVADFVTLVGEGVDQATIGD